MFPNKSIYESSKHTMNIRLVKTIDVDSKNEVKASTKNIQKLRLR